MYFKHYDRILNIYDKAENKRICYIQGQDHYRLQDVVFPLLRYTLTHLPYTNIHTHTLTHTQTHAHTHKHTHTCTHTSTHACTHTCTHTSTHACTHKHTRIHTQTKHTHTTHANTHTHTQKHIQLQTHTGVSVCWPRLYRGAPSEFEHNLLIDKTQPSQPSWRPYPDKIDEATNHPNNP